MAVSYARSGQVTVTTAGTAVAGPDVPGAVFALKALPGNSGVAYVGGAAGDVDSSIGYPLSAGESILIEVANLSLIWFDVATNGEKIAWIRVA